MLPEEQEFFEALYREIFPRLYGYAANQLSLRGFPKEVIPGLAEELIQDACHTAASRIKEMMSSPNPPGWLMTVLKNKLRVFLRQVHSDDQRLLSLDALSWEPPDPVSGSETAQADMEYADSMDKVRGSLPPDDYQLFEMVALNHASHKAAAEKFGITVWTSQKRLNRIRGRLQKIFPR